MAKDEYLSLKMGLESYETTDEQDDISDAVDNDNDDDQDGEDGHGEWTVEDLIQELQALEEES
ncbi:hypothetical protein BGZ95_008011 [Linnemannia exigua]|uniref:Uncharacterized protein n=1 Tax=Linnemannia exigua TaxID=604196 RepID=A0AAD4DER4_9FUNG|nr:hypothetical protein BGZ95_008011 [Linnemannia exigua]